MSSSQPRFDKGEKAIIGNQEHKYADWCGTVTGIEKTNEKYRYTLEFSDGETTTTIESDLKKHPSVFR